MNQIEKLGWLADKIPAFGDYGKDCANEKRKVEQADREAGDRVNGTYARRSKHSMALAVAAMIAASSGVY